jgi:hypothetical protein
MDRWALFTFATAISVAACSSGSDDLGGGSAPAYGAPAVDGGAYDGGNDSGGPAPTYGVPAIDAGPFDANVQPLYGLAFPDGGDGGDSGGPAPAYGLPFDAGHD